MTKPQITVVLLNWKRPTQCLELVRAYAEMPTVARVLVFNNNADVPLDGHHCRGWAVVINSNEDLGLPTRLAVAALARTSLVLLADDDIKLPASSVERLLEYWQLRPTGAVGLFGRQPKSDDLYPKDYTYGPCEVLLTRAFLTTPEIAAAAIRPAITMAEALPAEPFGNGEDIVLSYTAIKLSQQPNRAFRLPYVNVNYNDVHAISKRFPQHHEHRARVVAWCREHIVDPRQLV
jgi:GT2 family glycosyltransferase